MTEETENRIPFNRPPLVGDELACIERALSSDKISGDGEFSRACQAWFEDLLRCDRALITPSCTAALEMSAMLLNIGPGDEVIMPSYTFVSTANAFVLRGARIRFIDIREDTLNMNERLIEQAITANTRAVVPVHYAGVSCDMQEVKRVAAAHDIAVVEDAAQAALSRYKGEYVGGHGQLSAFSFHETKNYTSGGEGGMLMINDAKFIDRAEIYREKGTNRSRFFRGMVDKYTWVDMGSSYLPGELQAACLFAQLQRAQDILQARLHVWRRYHRAFDMLESAGYCRRPVVPDDCEPNAHMYYLLCNDRSARNAMIAHLGTHNIGSVFHYIPLHSAPAGERYGEFVGEDRFTTSTSGRIIRLPLFYGMTDMMVDRVIAAVMGFFGEA